MRYGSSDNHPRGAKRLQAAQTKSINAVPGRHIDDDQFQDGAFLVETALALDSLFATITPDVFGFIACLNNSSEEPSIRIHR